MDAISSASTAKPFSSYIPGLKALPKVTHTIICPAFRKYFALKLSNYVNMHQPEHPMDWKQSATRFASKCKKTTWQRLTDISLDGQIWRSSARHPLYACVAQGDCLSNISLHLETWHCVENQADIGRILSNSMMICETGIHLVQEMQPSCPANGISYSKISLSTIFELISAWLLEHSPQPLMGRQRFRIRIHVEEWRTWLTHQWCSDAT